MPSDNIVNYIHELTSICGRNYKHAIHRFSYTTADHQCETAIFGQYNNEKNIGYGWLISHSEIRVILKNNPIKMWKRRHQKLKYRVKITAIDLRRKYVRFVILCV